ncbi:MAG: cell division protein ZapA [Bacteroidales bacterium]|nr:cell division protein ZapA [Bacteroidales bacterium]MBK7173487.1 cell division protein ZapA [Bacteroidales bacterium]
MTDELGVTIHIANRPYRLFVKRAEEKSIRKAAKLVDDQINLYANTYSYNDKQDLLAMAALHFATDALNAEEESGFIQNQLHDTLTSIDNSLTEALKD